MLVPPLPVLASIDAVRPVFLIVMGISLMIFAWRLANGANDWAALLLELTGTDLTLCPACGARALLRTPLPAARAPPAEAP